MSRKNKNAQSTKHAAGAKHAANAPGTSMDNPRVVERKTIAVERTPAPPSPEADAPPAAVVPDGASLEATVVPDDVSVFDMNDAQLNAWYETVGRAMPLYHRKRRYAENKLGRDTISDEDAAAIAESAGAAQASSDELVDDAVAVEWPGPILSQEKENTDEPEGDDDDADAVAGDDEDTEDDEGDGAGVT